MVHDVSAGAWIYTKCSNYFTGVNFILSRTRCVVHSFLTCVGTMEREDEEGESEGERREDVSRGSDEGVHQGSRESPG